MGHLSEEGKSFLKGQAAALAEQSPEVPISVGRLCAGLGVQIVYRDSVPRFGAYVAYADSNGRDAIIFLPNEGAGSQFERFCIAHEIGHLLLMRAGIGSPTSTSDYWKFEEICDDFARRLLVPDALIEDYLTNIDPEAILTATFSLSKVARIPWMHAALRLTDLRADLNFLRFVPNEVGRIKIAATTFPGQKERGRFVNGGTELGHKIKKAFRNSADWNSRYLSSEALRFSGIPSLRGALEGAMATRRYGTRNEARLVVAW